MSWLRGKIMQWLVSKLDCPMVHDDPEDEDA